MDKQKLMKMLLVEDDESNQIALKFLLEKLGYVVDTASSAEMAIELLNFQHFNSKQDYDLVLTDHDMSNLTGIDVIEKSKKISDKTICWLMSGRVTDLMRQMAIDAGAVKVFQKPVTFDELKEAFAELQKS